MQAALDWITHNANALSGYVILIIMVVGLLWALGTGRIFIGRNVDKVLDTERERRAKCEAELLQCQHPPGGST